MDASAIRQNGYRKIRFFKESHLEEFYKDLASANKADYKNLLEAAQAKLAERHAEERKKEEEKVGDFISWFFR